MVVKNFVFRETGGFSLTNIVYLLLMPNRVKKREIVMDAEEKHMFLSLKSDSHV